MPQEFHVIRCHACETFQAHIVKKSNKWQCKMCGEKQSLKKVYFQGNGKNCRENVQALNEKRMINDLNKDAYIEQAINDETIEKMINEEPETFEEITNEEKTVEICKQSKWSQYLTAADDEDSSSENELSSDKIYTFSRPNNNKKRLSNKQINAEKTIEQKTNSETVEISNKKRISDVQNIVTNKRIKKQNCIETNFTSNEQFMTFSQNETAASNQINSSPQKNLIVNSKLSKWDCFVSDSNTEFHENNITVIPENISNSQVHTLFTKNIFNSTDLDDNLDDVLDFEM